MQEPRGNWISPGAASSANYPSIYISIYLSLYVSFSASPFLTSIYLRPASPSLWPMMR